MVTRTDEEATALIGSALQRISDQFSNGLITPSERSDQAALLYFEWVGKIGRAAVDSIFDRHGVQLTITTYAVVEVQWSDEGKG